MPLDQVAYFIAEDGVKTLVPTNRGGNHRDPTFIYEPNVPFKGTLKVLETSGARAQLQDTNTGTVYFISVNDLTYILAHSVVEYGAITGEWVIYKNAQAVGVKLTSPLPEVP